MGKGEERGDWPLGTGIAGERREEREEREREQLRMYTPRSGQYGC